MPMAHQPLAAVSGLSVGVAAEEGCDLRLDGLRQQRSRALAQNFGERIGERGWLDQLDDIILDHGVSLLWWRSGGLEHLHDTPPHPSRRHQLPRIPLTTVPLPFVWQTPASGFDCLVFLGLGLFGGFGHYFMARAFELAPAPFVSPFNYGQIIGATLLSVVVFGQLPDVWVWAGALVIAGRGGLRLYAERQARSQSQTSGS